VDNYDISNVKIGVLIFFSSYFLLIL